MLMIAVLPPFEDLDFDTAFFFLCSSMLSLSCCSCCCKSYLIVSCINDTNSSLTSLRSASIGIGKMQYLCNGSLCVVTASQYPAITLHNATINMCAFGCSLVAAWLLMSVELVVVVAMVIMVGVVVIVEVFPTAGSSSMFSYLCKSCLNIVSNSSFD